MRRTTSFERDFQDLHGRPLPRRRSGVERFEVEIVQEQPLPVSRTVIGLALGSLGFFWTLFFAVILAAMAVVGCIFIWALFNPAHLPG